MKLWLKNFRIIMNEKPDWDKMWSKTKAEIILLLKNRTYFVFMVICF